MVDKKQQYNNSKPLEEKWSNTPSKILIGSTAANTAALDQARKQEPINKLGDNTRLTGFEVGTQPPVNVQLPTIPELTANPYVGNAFLAGSSAPSQPVAEPPPFPNQSLSILRTAWVAETAIFRRESTCHPMHNHKYV